MANQILRVAKLKTGGNVRASLEHMLREKGRAPNADASRTHLNINSVRCVDEAWSRYKALDPEFKAKNNVQALEYMVTASPEFFHKASRLEWSSYLNESLHWIKERHGSKNIVAISLQRDESTPHLSVIVRPLIKRKIRGGSVRTALAARRFVNGRKMLSSMQDNFHDEVAQQYDLGRGNKGSLVEHKTLQSFYGEASGGATRIRDLERELKKMKEKDSKALKELEIEIADLKKEGGRWRKRAAQISQGWFSDDISNTKEPEVLRNLKNEVEASEVLPRSAKTSLSSMIDQQIDTLKPKASKVSSRGSRK